MFEFSCRVLTDNDTMIVTSLAGHMMELDFPEQFRSLLVLVFIHRKWSSVDPIQLFSLEVYKSVKEDMKQIYRNSWIAFTIRTSSERSKRMSGALLMVGLRSRGGEYCF